MFGTAARDRADRDRGPADEMPTFDRRQTQKRRDA
jgi:hypothetical protein